MSPRRLLSSISYNMIKRMVHSLIAVFICLPLAAFAQETSPTDPIIVKATDVLIFEMKANMKLTDDQVSAAREIIADYTAKVRDLQLSVENGAIDSKEMNDERQGLTDDENRKLSSVLSPDQMKVWFNLQEE